MQQLRFQHLQRAPLLPELRSQALKPRSTSAPHPCTRPAPLAWLLALIVVVAGLGLAPATAHAAEVLQVRSHAALQIGDGNRSYPVALACIRIAPEQEQAAGDWLRQQLPRRSRVNLRPFGSADGVLLARVSRLPGDASRGEPVDLGQGLVEAGLASVSAAGSAGCPEVA